MNKYSVLTVFLMLGNLFSVAQVHIDRRATLPINRCETWQLAMYQQLGVIGNNWNGIELIGTAPAENLVHQNTWWPIIYDGKAMKRTVTGQLINFLRRTAGTGESDDDFNFVVSPIKDELFEIAQRRFQSHFEVNGEIDLPTSLWNKYNEYYPIVPKQELDIICIYGPWVHDAIDFLGANHNYLEIHPTEQLWWASIHNKVLTYHLNLWQDCSGRFDNEDQYEEVQNLEFKNTWTKDPLKGIFSVAFESPLKTKTLDFQIKIQEINNGVLSNDQYKTHYLIFKNDTIAKVTEPPGLDYFKVKFDSLAIDAYSILPNFATGVVDTLIKGFIVIETNVEKKYFQPPGYIIFNVEERNMPELNKNIQLKFNVEVILDSLKCLSVDDDKGNEDLFGYFGVKIVNESQLPLGATIHGSEPSNLLWKRLDGSSLHLRKNQVEKINKKILFNLNKTDTLIIVGDLNEDDDNDDGNPNDTDTDNNVEDEDDYLGNPQFAKITDFHEGLKKNFVQYFRSGRTDVRAYFTIRSAQDLVKEPNIKSSKMPSQKK